MSNVRLRGLARGRGGLVTVGTVAALLAGIGATLFGLGAANNAIANFDAASWLWSNNKGEVARVNGVTGRVDTRYKVSDALGHSVQVSQSDRYVILRDLTTGKVSVLDLASLHLAASTQTTAGIGVTVAVHGDSAFVIDAVQGAVSQLNPATLTPIGAPLRFMPGLSGGTFDNDGRLWLLVPGEGTAVAIQPTATPSAKPSKDGGAGGAASSDPKVVKTLSIADPSHDLALSVLDHGVAVLDKTAAVLTTVRDDVTTKTTLAMSGPGAMPLRTTGADVPVTVVDGRNVYVVSGAKVSQFTVPGEGPKLSPCVAWSTRLYCADEASGNVYVLDGAGRLTTTITLPNSAGAPLDLEVREDHLFINAPTTSTAQVVDGQGRAKLVDKYANNILGGDPPPPVPPPPPQQPPVGPPGAPVNVRAAAGNAQARVTWNPAPANGAPIVKYVVEGDGKPHDVGANQRSLDVTGLTNGQTYTFTVYAVNAKGSGPKRAANPVVPTAEVPDPPASVTAAENKDGTVTVTWPAANGQGHAVTRYVVSAIAAGAPPVQVGEATTTALTLPAGPQSAGSQSTGAQATGPQLTFGTQYAFTVTAVNDKGASSKASPLSNTVVPYAVPGKPVNLKAVTSADTAGTITVNWSPPSENGRPITGYVVTANGRSQDVAGSATSATVTGLGNGARVTVRVHAVNVAGTGPDATTTASTIAPPKVTVTSTSSNQTSVTVNFSADLGGAGTSASHCTLAVAGSTPQPGGCSSITISGLRPSSTYNLTVTVTNPAGSATAPAARATTDVVGVSVCNNNLASVDPAQHTWCDNPNNGMEVYSGTSESTTRLGRGGNGSSYTAICYANGELIKPYVYNRGKQDTTTWIRINFGTQQGYMSFAWFNINGVGINSTGALPAC